jgi:Lon protease-like protein
MSEIELPLFPLPIVVFPGTPQPLHIFEPRYRQLLDDCLAGDQRFGLTVIDDNKPRADGPNPGNVGCIMRSTSHDKLLDGRSNILTVGEDRYVLKRLVQRDRLYFVGLVEPFHDVVDPDPELSYATQQLKAAFTAFTKAFHELVPSADESLELPQDPVQLSFHVAAALPADLDTKVSMLRLTSTKVRLNRLRELIKSKSGEIARWATATRSAKRNGKPERDPVSAE